VKIQEKVQNVLLMIKIYEALLDYRIGTWSINSSDTAQSIISLFKGYTRLVEITKVYYNKNICCVDPIDILNNCYVFVSYFLYLLLFIKFICYLLKYTPKIKKGEGKNKRTQSDTNNTTIRKAGRSNQIKLLPSIVDLSIVCKSLSLFYLYVSFNQFARFKYN